MFQLWLSITTYALLKYLVNTGFVKTEQYLQLDSVSKQYNMVWENLAGNSDAGISVKSETIFTAFYCECLERYGNSSRGGVASVPITVKKLHHQCLLISVKEA